jgi:hypothetical protein
LDDLVGGGWARLMSDDLVVGGVADGGEGGLDFRRRINAGDERGISMMP